MTFCICDQLSNNRSAYAIFEVPTEEPFFNVENQKVIAIHDVLHLFKNVKNNIQDGNFRIDGKTTSFTDNIKVYRIDKNNLECRALPKLTNVHISNKFGQKMSVKLVLQAMSHSVAIRTLY